MEFTAGGRPPRTYRGSRRRLRRIKLRDNGSWELWALVAWLTVLMLVVASWALRQGH